VKERAKTDEPRPGPADPGPWWPELLELVEYCEGEVARREGRVPRPTEQVCAAIEREYQRAPWWRP
jgi:hypothetical protein